MSLERDAVFNELHRTRDEKPLETLRVITTKVERPEEYGWVTMDGSIVFAPDAETSPLVLAHEIAHVRLKHPTERPALQDEKDAWELAAKYLRRSGEWTPANKERAARLLASYYDDEDGLEKSKRFIKRL